MKGSRLQQILLLTFLSLVILCGQIESEVLFSPDGIVYALVGKELSFRPLHDWAILTWNQSPFYEHPHLTPWLLGGFMKLFGVSTVSAVLPIVIISTLTVLLTYALGRTLINHSFGILAATLLILTPQFIKNGRNPMLEPVLMFCIMLTIYFHLLAALRVKSNFWTYTLFSGFSLGLAFLAKGPPAILALGVIFAFQGLVRISGKGTIRQFQMPAKLLGVHALCLVLISTGLVGLIDLWHQSLTGSSFFIYYFTHQLRHTVLEARGATQYHFSFYWDSIRHYWPWLPFVLASGPLVLWKKDRVALPALWIGSTVVLGTFTGFSILKHQSPWFVSIFYVGSSLLAGLSLRYFIQERMVEKYYARFCGALLIPTLFLSASFPSLFTHYERPFEHFLEASSTAVQKSGIPLEGKLLADCIQIPEWRGEFFLKFYLGMGKTHCNDPSTPYQIVESSKVHLIPGEFRILFAQQPYLMIERVSNLRQKLSNPG